MTDSKLRHLDDIDEAERFRFLVEQSTDMISRHSQPGLDLSGCQPGG
ncbi:hypothetical protein [Aliamphritea spongicola]|nr:hypothetical protein [Aliamphritea spongicola]